MTDTLAAGSAATGPRHDAELTVNSTSIRLLLAITFLYPVVLTAVFFPTPASDLREHINLGLTLPLYTWKNPPLQTWLAGGVALLGARDAWPFVLVAQALNFIGLIYLVAIARKFIGPQAVVPLIILFCGSAYYSLAVPSMVLNADQIEVPIWAAIFYHALSAGRDDRWRDWLLTGVLFGVAFLAKYSAVVMLAALLIGAFCVPSYRKIFVNRKLYAAALVSVPIIAINVIPELLHGDAIHYGADKFNGAFLPSRLVGIGHLLRSFVLYGAPALIGIAVLAWHRDVGRPRWPSDLAQRVIVFSALAILAAMVLLIVIPGLRNTTRYAYPFYGLCLLALLCAVDIAPQGWRRFANVTLAIWAAIIAGTLVYTQFFINSRLREPAPAAADTLRSSWDGQFSCGPAYILGDDRTARGIAIYFNRGVHGIALDEINRKDWFNPDEVERRGMIVLTTPDQVAAIGPRWLAGRTVATLDIPYRRTLQSRTHGYVYAFVPPRDCPRGTPATTGK